MSSGPSLKRPSSEPVDNLKRLICKFCEKDDAVLNLKSCGCLFCDSCDDDARVICISCRHKMEPMMKVSFMKEKKCKYYAEKCSSSAEYRCKCIQEGYVCHSCLTHLHSKRLNGVCDPVHLVHKIDYGPCHECKDFVAEFEEIQSGKRICLDCSHKSIGECKKLESEPDLKLIGEEHLASLVKVNAENTKCMELKKSGEFDCQKKMAEIQTILNDIISNVSFYAEECNRRKLQEIHEYFVNFKVGSNLRTIVDQLKQRKLKLQKQEQLLNFLRFCRNKNSVSRMKRIKINQLYGLNEHLAMSDELLSKIIQMIIDKRTEPFYIMVEKPGLQNKRAKMLKDIKKHEAKWVKMGDFQVKDVVIIHDAHEIDNYKLKRAEIRSIDRLNDAIVVLLLDFGYEITISANAVGKIADLNIAGQPTCFIAQLIGDTIPTDETPGGSKGQLIAKHFII